MSHQEEILRALHRIEVQQNRMFSLLIAEGVLIIMTIEELTTQVAANTDAEDSAVILIKGLANQLAAVAGDPAKVTALAAKLKASADALSAAVVANTPTSLPAGW